MATSKPISILNIIVNKSVELFFKYKQYRGNCSSCSKSLIIFRRKHLCTLCNVILCSKCLQKFESPLYLVWRESFKSICPKCLKEKTNQYSNYDNAKRVFNDIETISINYKGPLKIIKGSEKEKIVTLFWKDKDDALMSLKISAAFINCNTLYNVKYETELDSEGNFIFKRYQYSGIPALKK